MVFGSHYFGRGACIQGEISLANRNIFLKWKDIPEGNINLGNMLGKLWKESIQQMIQSLRVGWFRTAQGFWWEQNIKKPHCSIKNVSSAHQGHPIVLPPLKHVEANTSVPLTAQKKSNKPAWHSSFLLLTRYSHGFENSQHPRWWTPNFFQH